MFVLLSERPEGSLKSLTKIKVLAYEISHQNKQIKIIEKLVLDIMLISQAKRDIQPSSYFNLSLYTAAEVLQYLTKKP